MVVLRDVRWAAASSVTSTLTAARAGGPSVGHGGQRLQRPGDLADVVSLRVGERQRHIAPPSRPESPGLRRHRLPS